MGLRAFDVPTMIAISDPWVDGNKERPLLTGLSLTAGLVPLLDTAHDALLRLQVTPSESDSVLRALAEEAVGLDADHDQRYRAMHAVLAGWIAVSDEERRRTIEAIMATLWPEGAMGVQRTYLAEAGNVELAVSRLTPEMAETLDGISVDGKSVLALFNEWVEVGRRLGDVERERIRLAEHRAGDQVTARDIQAARFQWIRVVNALCALLELESGIPEEARVRILQPLLTAEERAARKRSAGASSEAPEPAGPEEGLEVGAPFLDDGMAEAQTAIHSAKA